jgi:hypothetical protein
MTATFGIENVIREVMERIRLTPTVLGRLTQLYNTPGYSQARISQAFSGVKRFDNQQGQRLLEFVREIEALCKTVELPLDLTEPERIKHLLDMRRAFKLAAKYDEDRVRELLLEPCNAAAGAE